MVEGKDSCKDARLSALSASDLKRARPPHDLMRFGRVPESDWSELLKHKSAHVSPAWSWRWLSIASQREKPLVMQAWQAPILLLASLASSAACLPYLLFLLLASCLQAWCPLCPCPFTWLAPCYPWDLSPVSSLGKLPLPLLTQRLPVTVLSQPVHVSQKNEPPLLFSFIYEMMVCPSPPYL